MTKNHSSQTTINIDTNKVKYVAKLVRLGITEEEAAAFSPQLAAIIDYFNLLNEVETRDTPPASETSTIRSVMRADEVQPSMPRQDFLKNVPHQDGEYVQVPKVFGEE